MEKPELICQFKHGKFKCENKSDKITGLCEKHFEKLCNRIDKLIAKQLNK